jgi:hypothetical protein
MTLKLIIASALLLLVTACVVSPYGESPAYHGAYYGNPGYGGYHGNAGYAGREGFYRGGEDRHEGHDGDRDGERHR